MSTKTDFFSGLFFLLALTLSLLLSPSPLQAQKSPLGDPLTCGPCTERDKSPSTQRRKSFSGYPRGSSQPVIPAYAGIQCVAGGWIPACAGMTVSGTGEKLLPTSSSRDASGGSSISRTEGNLSEDYLVTIIQSVTGPTIEFVFAYNSYSADGSQGPKLNLGLGLGWTYSFNIILDIIEPNIFRIDSGGRVTKFSPGPGGTFTPTTSCFETLVQKRQDRLHFCSDCGHQYLKALAARPA